ncbi:MAG: hypothetical protein J6W24_06020 [Prevotella sp.]|nr:hypothetical protein [Prevotella sp.]
MKITKEQIAGWKKKHGEVFQITVDGKSCVLRRPTRRDLSYVSTIKEDKIQVLETLLNQLWVDGDKEIKEDDQLFFAVAQKMETILEVKEAEIKKL